MKPEKKILEYKITIHGWDIYIHPETKEVTMVDGNRAIKMPFGSLGRLTNTLAALIQHLVDEGHLGSGGKIDAKKD